MNEIPFSRSHAVQHKIDRSFSCAVRRKVKFRFRDKANQLIFKRSGHSWSQRLLISLTGWCSTNKSSSLPPHDDILHTRLYLPHSKRRKKIKRERCVLRDRPTAWASSSCRGKRGLRLGEGKARNIRGSWLDSLNGNTCALPRFLLINLLYRGIQAPARKNNDS